MKHFELKNAVIIITGASSGIGAASAREFANRGAHVVLAARRRQRLDKLAQELRATGVEAVPIEADMSKHSDIESVVSKTMSKFGKIDILFNNAGFGRLDFLEKLHVDSDISSQIQVNVLGVIHMTHAVLPHMMKARQGHIINMSSLAGWVATPTYSVYSATKFAIRGFSESLRREVSPWGIAVSTIYPFSVATEFGEHAGINRKSKSLFTGNFVMSADFVGKEVVKTASHPKKMVVLPKIAALGIWFNQAFPGIVDWLTIKRFTIPERIEELEKGK